MPLLSKKPRTKGVSDPVKLLVIDHQKVERLFEQIEEAESPVQRLGLVAQLEAELIRHTTVEERILYPFIRDHVPDGPEMVEEANQEHAEAKEALARVATLDPAAPNFLAQLKKLKKLKKLVSHHVKEEENGVFPKMDESVDVQELNGLRAALERARMEETPTPALPADRSRSRTTTRRASRSTASRTTKTKTTTTQSKPQQAKRSTRRPAARTKSASSSVWVQPHHTDDGRWQVRREGASRASRVFDTQREAASFGCQLAKRERVEFVLAGRDGKVRERDSYGHDPANRRG